MNPDRLGICFLAFSNTSESSEIVAFSFVILSPSISNTFSPQRHHPSKIIIHTYIKYIHTYNNPEPLIEHFSLSVLHPPELF
jgi:hypothetical protein